LESVSGIITPAVVALELCKGCLCSGIRRAPSSNDALPADDDGVDSAFALPSKERFDGMITTSWCVDRALSNAPNK
jgi:hypothetical protein